MSSSIKIVGRSPIARTIATKTGEPQRTKYQVKAGYGIGSLLSTTAGSQSKTEALPVLSSIVATHVVTQKRTNQHHYYFLQATTAIKT